MLYLEFKDSTRRARRGVKYSNQWLEWVNILNKPAIRQQGRGEAQKNKTENKNKKILAIIKNMCKDIPRNASVAQLARAQPCQG